MNINLTENFITQVFTCACEICHDRGNRTPKHALQSSRTYRGAIHKCYIIDCCLLGFRFGFEF